MAFKIPPKSAVGVLDPEIANEGQKVILTDDTEVAYLPPPVKPVIPDLSQVKSIMHYFNRTGYRVYPAWLYHPDEPPRLCKDGHEAGALGVYYREATNEEKGRYGRSHVWDWGDESKWRPIPYKAEKFDPRMPGTGKTFVPMPANPEQEKNALIVALLPQVVGAVTAALRAGNPVAPGGVDPAQWDEFLKFQAWKESQRTVEKLADGELDLSESAAPALSSPTDDERTALEAQAKALGVRVDGRWSLPRLKEEISRAA